MNSSLNFKLTAGLLALALVVGGAGVSFPLLQLALGTAAVLVAAYFVISEPGRDRGPLDHWALILLGFTFLLPLIQLIPLPPAIWHLFPGRDVPKEIDAILGLASWRPWTLDVEGTVRSWLVLVPAAVVFIGCLRLGTRERVRLLWVVAGFALLNAFLGIVQLATGGGATPYPSTHSGDPIGFFVNRNHSAAIMLAAMPLVAALASARSRRVSARTTTLAGAIASISVLAIVVLGTTSRTGLLLLPVSLVVSLFLLFRHQTRLRSALPALLAVFAVGLVLVTSRGFDRVLDRFSSDADPRFAYWSDVQWALQHYGLAGAGVGTFIPVFQSAESLEAVGPLVVNHAHNDYLEILLGGGIPGALLFGAFLTLIVVALLRAGKTPQDSGVASLRLATATAIALLLAYSVVDYPLRMPAIAAAFAVFCAFLLPVAPAGGPASEKASSRRNGSGQHSTRLPRNLILAALGPLVVIGLVMLQAGMSARAILDKRFDEASYWAHWSTKANASQATVELTNGDIRQAWRSAHVAQQLSPISAEAIRNLALIRLSQGSSDGHQLMRTAAALGWRDVMTQLWTIEASQRLGETEKAVQRAEGLFRQGKLVGPTLELLLRLPKFEPVSQLLADRLAQQPPWRDDVLHSAGSLPPAEFERFKAIVSRLDKAGAPVRSEEMKPVIKALVSRGRVGEAQRLWVQMNPTLIDNGNFDLLKDAGAGSRLPAGWDTPSQSRGATTVMAYGPKGRDRALRIGPTDWVSIISQETMLPAGSYVLSYDARELGPTPIVLRWQLRCRESAKTQVGETRLRGGEGWKRFTTTFDVPSRDCINQRLALSRFEADNQAETLLDRVSIARTGD